MTRCPPPVATLPDPFGFCAFTVRGSPPPHLCLCTPIRSWCLRYILGAVAMMGRFVPLRVRAAVLGVVLLGYLAGTQCVRPSPGTGDDRRGAPNHVAHKETEEDDLVEGTSATGSRLPDCSHACGPCSPCRRVMVTFECSIAESCPIVYRCMCRGRYYQVPSN